MLCAASCAAICQEGHEQCHEELWTRKSAKEGTSTNHRQKQVEIVGRSGARPRWLATRAARVSSAERLVSHVTGHEVTMCSGRV